ncbi:MAG: hypothetical protein WDN75_21240 [Bacteroidota bacterium]
MKKKLVLITFCTMSISFLFGQNLPNDKQTKDIYSLIDNYSQAREKRDTVLLKKILTTDIDQLVSTGEWRNGVGESVKRHAEELCRQSRNADSPD